MRRSILLTATFLTVLPLLASAATCPSLSRGSTGSSVTQLQQFLSSQYQNFPTATGYYGAITEAAVQQWQREHGIEARGIVGPKTAAAMKLNLCTTSTSPSTNPTQALIDSLLIQLHALQAQLATLLAQQNPQVITVPPIATPPPTPTPSPSACSLNGSTVASGASVTAYQSLSVPYGSTCSQETRICSNGTFSGSYTYASCSVSAAQSCSFNGATILNGQSTTAYQTSSVAYGQTCTSQTRSCANGVLSGTYQSSACTVAQPLSCSWNSQTVASGANITAYQSSSVPSGQQCVSQQRSCSNGVLSGSYINAACSVQAAQPLSVTFTINGSSNVILHVGDSYHYAWSSINAVSVTSTFTQENTSCGITGTGPFDDLGKVAASGSYSSVTESCFLGHTYVLTFTATDASGHTAAANVTMTVAMPPAAAAPSLVVPVTHFKLGVGEPLITEVVAGSDAVAQTNALLALKPQIMRLVLDNPNWAPAPLSTEKQIVALVQQAGVDSIGMSSMVATPAPGLPCPSQTAAYQAWLSQTEAYWYNLARQFPEITKWEVGNETNNTLWQKPVQSGPGACGLAAFTSAQMASMSADGTYYAHRGIKRANPNATVIFPGFVPPNFAAFSASADNFLEQLYTYIQSSQSPSRNPRDYFDAMAWHPYQFIGYAPSDDFIGNNQVMFSTMASHGDGAVPVYFTEFGSPTGADIPATEADVKALLLKEFDQIQDVMPQVAGATLFRGIDVLTAADNGEPGGVLRYYGLLSPTLQKKDRDASLCSMVRCAPYVGNLEAANTFYYSNGSSYCSYPSQAVAQQQGGFTDVYTIPHWSAMPASLQNGGACAPH